MSKNLCNSCEKLKLSTQRKVLQIHYRDCYTIHAHAIHLHNFNTLEFGTIYEYNLTNNIL